jgi:hypothetical protein
MVLALGLLLIGILARFLPHVPNFTPVIAIALFGGVYLRRSYALFLPLLLMVVTDLFLGTYPAIYFTWASVVLVSAIGFWVRGSMSRRRMLGGALASAVLFFLVTNFGCWLTEYPKTLEGFISCFTLAVPFFRMTLLSTLVYAVVLFGSFELMAAGLRKTRLAAVLLK